MEYVVHVCLHIYYYTSHGFLPFLTFLTHVFYLATHVFYD